MEAKHTPGPWKISFKENNQHEIENESGQMGIARVWDYDTDEAVEANSKLIAAAPELLEALEMCEPYMSDLDKDNWSDPKAGIFQDTMLTAAVNKLRAAIKKATQ